MNWERNFDPVSEETVRLIDGEGLTFQEAADYIGCSVATIRRRYSRFTILFQPHAISAL